MEMKVALVVGIKKSNLYLLEYVQHYINLGFSKIILCDNNEIDDENPMDVLSSIDSSYLIYENFRGVHDPSRQWGIYTAMYKKYRHDFDWMCFFDDDEYLKLYHHSTVSDWLSMRCFDDADVVAVNWRMMSDSGHILYEDKPVLERFTIPCNLEVRAGYSFSHNNHIKSIIRCPGYVDSYCDHPHYFRNSKFKLITKNDKGDLMRSSYPFNQYDYTYASLDHYQTKSTEEFCDRRLSNKRQKNNERFDGTKRDLTQETIYYFRLNGFSQEKLDFITSYIKKYHLR